MGALLCRTRLNYTDASGLPAPTEVAIGDGRTAGLPGWEEAGFELVAHRSAIGEWADDDQLVAIHHAEMEALARAMTGCDHATVTSHITRGPQQAARHADLGPITFVHSDFAAGYDAIVRRVMQSGHGHTAAALAHNGLTPDAFERARRTVILQFWRNVGPPRMDLPIAFCDARSVEPDDARAFPVRDYAGAGGPTFDALAVRPSDPVDRHRWYAFPDLGRDEVVAFRTYDSDLVAVGATYFTPHSAFRDPTVPLGQPARVSIELRATCLFE